MMEPVVAMILPNNVQFNLAISDVPTSLPGGHKHGNKRQTLPRAGIGLEAAFQSSQLCHLP